MTKADLIKRVMDVGLNKQQAAMSIELVFETIKDCLNSDEKVKIMGFGRFDVKTRSSRMVRNPKTGEKLKIDSRKLVYFKPAKRFIEDLNK